MSEFEKYRCSICCKKTYEYEFCENCNRYICFDENCQHLFIVFCKKEFQIIDFGAIDDYEIISECVYCTKDKKKMKWYLRSKQ